MLEIRRLGYALGARVDGVDLSAQLDDQVVAEIRQAWLDHVVLVFRNQRLSPQAQVAFAERFGPLHQGTASVLDARADVPAIHYVVSRPIEIGGVAFRSAFGDEWHSDQSYTIRPGTGTFLHALDLPDVGGDTMFANMYAAFETLSPALQRIAETLEGVHDLRLSNSVERLSEEQRAQRIRDNPPVVHPLVQTHPESGRKSLFVGCRLRQFDGMTQAESRPLIDFLNAHATRYEFVYRHRWEPGDLVMWDNRCTLHFPIGDYDHRQLRRMQRCTQAAPVSGRLYDPDDIRPREALLAAN